MLISIYRCPSFTLRAYVSLRNTTPLLIHNRNIDLSPSNYETRSGEDADWSSHTFRLLFTKSMTSRMLWAKPAAPASSIPSLTQWMGVIAITQPTASQATPRSTLSIPTSTRVDSKASLSVERTSSPECSAFR